jgi:hypothetical protein
MVAGRKVPAAVRHYVRSTLEAVTSSYTGGQIEAGHIRFRRMDAGAVVARGADEVFPRGQINVTFSDDGFYSAGGAHIVEAHTFVQGPLGVSLQMDLDGCLEDRSLSHCLTIISGSPRYDVASLERALRRGSDSHVKHEYAHVLGMDHRMESSHGISATLLCSIMGGPCDRSPGMGATSHVDQVMARLAYSRAPGNDVHDRDPYPGPPIRSRGQQ